MPLSAIGQVDAGQRSHRSDGCFDQNTGVRLWVGAVEGGGPGPPDGHRLVLAARADEKLEDPVVEVIKHSSSLTRD